MSDFICNGWEKLSAFEKLKIRWMDCRSAETVEAYDTVLYAWEHGEDWEACAEELEEILAHEVDIEQRLKAVVEKYTVMA